MKWKREGGFTLIELMVVIAIIAILAAIAVGQYQGYKRQAKAKDLISIARNCAAELVSACLVQGNGTTVSLDDYSSCKDFKDSYSEVGEYLKAKITNTNNFICGQIYDVTAQGYVDNKTSYCYEVTCSIDDKYNVKCTTIKKSSNCG